MPTPDRSPESARRWTLITAILASGAVFLSGSVVNVALPAIGAALETGLSGLQWVIDGYTLTLASLLILGGVLGDRFGRRRMCLIGATGFGLALVACGLAPSIEWLMGLRAVQGVAGALMVPESLALIRAVYTDEEERGEAIGAWSGWTGIAVVIGPLLGGWLVDTFSWRWAFFAGVPLLAVTAWLLCRRVPESRSSEPSAGLDWLGAVLVTFGLGGVVYGLIEGPVVGWGSTGVLAGLIGGAVAFVLFPFVEAWVENPLVPLSLFKSRNFSGANLTTLAVYAALQGANFLLVIYIQSVMGYSALQAGLMLAPTSLLLLLLSSFFGRLAGRYGPRLFMMAGPLVCGIGLALLARLHPEANIWSEVLPGTVVFGLGLAGTVAPLTDTVMSAVSDAHSGVAAAFNNMVSRVAALLAVAGLGALVSLSFGAALDEQIAIRGLSPTTVRQLRAVEQDPTAGVDEEQLPLGAVQAFEAAYTVGFRQAMIMGAILAALGGIIAFLTIRNPAYQKEDLAVDEEHKMKTYKYVIVGGGLAGGRACEGIRKVDSEGSIVLVTQEPHRPYERPPLSKKYLRDEVGLERVYLQDEGYYAEHHVDLIQGVKATALDTDARTVKLEDGQTLEYEKLLLATGGQAWRLPLPGADLENVFTLRTIEDSQHIREAVGDGKRALVMGGSFIGAEVSASLAQLGVDVTEIFPESRLLELIVPPEVSQHLKALFEEHGVRVLPGVVAEKLEGDGRVERAVLDNGDTLAVDLVVMGVGIKLNTGLAREAGLDTREEDGAVIVDENLRTSDTHIYAAGDIAAWPDATFDRQLRVEHWDVARRQGLRAGRAMAGDEEAYTALPYFFSDLFDLSFEVWGDLSNWERTVLRGSLEKGSFAYYYFAQDRLTGVLAVGRPDAERASMQSLVEARPAYDEVAAGLQDESVDLADLVDQEEDAGAGEEGETAELSFAEHIAPLFREKDVDEMKDISGFDLSDYEDVRKRAEGIHARLVDGSMPCDGPWPEEKVARFKRWMDQGMKE
jgi:EmrB/QacA subfamily drug resistance transporter